MTLAKSLPHLGLVLPRVQQGGLPSSDMLWPCGPFSDTGPDWEDGKADSCEMLARVAHLHVALFPDDLEQTCLSCFFQTAATLTSPRAGATELFLCLPATSCRFPREIFFPFKLEVYPLVPPWICAAQVSSPWHPDNSQESLPCLGCSLHRLRRIGTTFPFSPHLALYSGPCPGCLELTEYCR